MVYNTELLGFWTASIIRYSRKQKTRRFGNWIYFRPLVRGEAPILLGLLERANINLVAEIFEFLEYQTMERVQNPVILCTV
jgi:hypothetical protein